MTTAMTQSLRVEGLTKYYGRTRVLDSVSVEFRGGEVHGLLGHNGSGKSTLIKVLAGVVRPNAGILDLGDRTMTLPLSPADVAAAGLRFVHQSLGLVQSLSVGENLFLDALSVPGQSSRRWINWRQLHRDAQGLLHTYGIAVSSRRVISDLPPAYQARIAIVRAVRDQALDGNARVGCTLILDEPTVFLPHRDTDELFGLLRSLAREGHGVVLVSHRMDEVLANTDRMTILREGHVAARVETRTTSKNMLVDLMFAHHTARESKTSLPTATTSTSPPPITVRNLRTARVKGLDLDLVNGEIVGITGLIGSGFEDVPHALFGAGSRVSGELSLTGRTYSLVSLNPHHAIAGGIALIPADRARRAIARNGTVQENLTMLRLSKFFRAGLLSRKSLAANAAAAIDTYDISPKRRDVPVDQLSGGNQQRVVLGKWLSTDPKLMLLHEPTQGVDLAARQEIWDFIRAAAGRGAVVVLASTDYEELAEISTRVLVIAGGLIATELRGSEMTPAHIAAEAMAGVSGTGGSN